MDLRLANETDVDLLYRWANDEKVRINSFSPGQIKYEDHRKWLTKKLDSGKSFIFIFSNEGDPIGQVRLDVEGIDAYIDYSIDAVYRGRGYGQMMLSLLEGKVKEILPEVKNLKAKVRTQNIASRSVFEKCSFEQEYVEYSKSI